MTGEKAVKAVTVSTKHRDDCQLCLRQHKKMIFDGKQLAETQTGLLIDLGWNDQTNKIAHRSGFTI